MDYWKVFFRLISKHWRSHLALPLFVGIVVETLIGLASLKERSFYLLWKFLSSWDGLPAHLGILSIVVTYLCVAVWSIHKDASRAMNGEAGEQLDQILAGATSFFATCTIPLEDWFHPQTQQYFSCLLKHELSGADFQQHRVLLFKNDDDLKMANEQYLDAHYSKPLIHIHRNYRIPLGYLRRKEIDEILTTFELVEKAEDWKVQDEREVSNQGCVATISTLDFGLVGYKDKDKDPRVISFDKTGHSIRLDPRITDPTPYLSLWNKIRTKVFNEEGLPHPEHDFAVHCGVERLKVPVPLKDIKAAQKQANVQNINNQ